MNRPERVNQRRGRWPGADGRLPGGRAARTVHVTGVDDARTTVVGQRRGFVDDATTDLAEGVQDADLVVLATPVRTILRLLDEIGPLLKPGHHLMDLGSTKAEIAAKMADLPDTSCRLALIPCAARSAGIAARRSDPLSGAHLHPHAAGAHHRRCSILGDALAVAVGARPLLLEPNRQDMLTATISHLPYLLACALVATADATTSSDPAAWDIVAGGFRDTSRVAGSDVTMMLDILLTNRAHVLDALATCLRPVGQRLSALVEEGMKPHCAIRWKDSCNTKGDVPMSQTTFNRRALHGRMRVPGDKSLSHRAVLLGALAAARARSTAFCPRTTAGRPSPACARWASRSRSTTPPR